MTLTEIKKKILNKYKTGQVVTLKYRDNEKRVKEKRKAEIIKFYPHIILCKVDNCRECFTYADLNGLTTYSRKEVGEE